MNTSFIYSRPNDTISGAVSWHMKTKKLLNTEKMVVTDNKGMLDLFHQARCNGLAQRIEYTAAMEREEP